MSHYEDTVAEQSKAAKNKSGLLGYINKNIHKEKQFKAIEWFTSHGGDNNSGPGVLL
jgi:hypothetical protein